MARFLRASERGDDIVAPLNPMVAIDRRLSEAID
jgi:hypothetical protein